MLLPDILLSTPHLPIKVTTTLTEALQLCSIFYEVDLDPAAFKESQAFMGSDGRVKLELIDKDSNTLITTFVNRTLPQLNDGVEQDSSGSWELKNPLSLNVGKKDLLGPPLTVVSPAELSFLNDLVPGEAIPLSGSSGDHAFKLSNLLNEYGYLMRWVSGTMGGCSTAGFEVVYRGDSVGADPGFLLEPSPDLVIIKLHHGEVKGYICLRT